MRLTNHMLRIASAMIVAVALIAPSIASAQERRIDKSGAIDFSLRDMDGHPVKLSQYRGHPVVIDFWATWCPPCRRQIPELQQLYSRYHKSKGLMVLGVACDTIQGEGANAVRPFAKEYAITYPILLADPPVLDSFGVEAIPTMIFLGADGSVLSRMMGAGGPGELTASITSLLAHPGKPKPDRKLSPQEEKKQNLFDIEYRK